jgi:hypothetical protein
MIDAALAEQQRATGTAASTNVQPRLVSTGKARNNDASALDRFAAVALRDPIITVADNLVEFQRQPTFEAYVAEAADVALAPNRVGVLLVPLAADKIGAVCLDGVVPCRVDMIDAAHQWADLTSGQTYLTSSTKGAAEVLWAEGGTGQQWALVRLGAAKIGGRRCLLDSTSGTVAFGGTAAALTWSDPGAAKNPNGFWTAGDPTKITLPAGTWKVGGLLSMSMPTPVENGGISSGYVGTSLATLINACYAIAALGRNGSSTITWRQVFTYGPSSVVISAATVSFERMVYLTGSEYFTLGAGQTSTTETATLAAAEFWATEV